MTSPRAILTFLLALALVRGIIYAAAVPPWQAPDEPPHFERAKAALNTADWLSNSQNPPNWYEQLTRSLFMHRYYDYLDTPRQTYSPATPINRHIALYQEHYGDLYGSRPAYAVMGWPLLVAQHQDITLQLYLVRLNTILMNMGIILLAYLITKLIFPTDPFLYWGVPSLVLFNPQHTHLLSTVNSGNLAELLAATALYFIVKGISKGFSWFTILLTLIFSLAAMWSKATAYFLPFAIGAVGLFYLWKYRRFWKWLLPAAVVITGVVYLLAPERLKLLVIRGIDTLQSRGFYLDPIVPQDLFRSFWAMPGWTIFYLYPGWYQVLLLGCIVAAIGLILLVIKQWRHIVSGRYRVQVQTLAVLAVAMLAAIGILLIWNGISHSIVYRQGRSIYPVIIPISIFLMLGWRQFIPQAWRNIGLLGITTVFFLFDTMVLFGYIIPFFYSRY